MRGKTTIAGAVAVALCLLGTAPLKAQLWEAGLPGEDLGSISLLGGLLQPNTTYDDGSTFESGMGFGASVAVWPWRHVGVRATLLRGRTEGKEGEVFSPLRFQNPTIWLYNLDLALRYPLMTESSLALAPYIAAGVGGKTFRWDPSWPEQIGFTSRTLTAAGGIEVRPTGGGRALGLIAEVRGYRYGYTGFQYQWGDGIGRHIGDPQDSTDLLFTLGLTLNR